MYNFIKRLLALKEEEEVACYLERLDDKKIAKIIDAIEIEQRCLMEDCERAVDEMNYVIDLLKTYQQKNTLSNL